jgi:hypothetical protein
MLKTADKNAAIDDTHLWDLRQTPPENKRRSRIKVGISVFVEDDTVRDKGRCVLHGT